MELSIFLISFNDCATVETLQAELTNFATHWERLKMSTLDSFYSVKTVKELSGEDTNLSGADEGF